MKCTSALLAITTVMASSVSAIVIDPPDGSTCWASTFAIVGSEIGAIFDPSLAAQQRTYMACPGTTTIGDLDPVTLQPAGGDLPLFTVNPNFHLKCAEPGTCIFSGGTQQLSAVPVSDIGLVAAFVGSQGLTLPDGWLPDSSNLLVEGIVFEGSRSASAAFAAAPVVLFAKGTNMRLENIVVRNCDPDSPPFSAIYLNSHEPTNADGLHSAVTITGSRIENCPVQYAVVSAIHGTGTPPGTDEPRAIQLTIEDTVFDGNSVVSTDNTRSALISVFFTTLKLVGDVVFTGNTMASGFAPIVLVNSELESDVVDLSDTMIANDTSECEEVESFSMTFDVNPGCSCLENLVFTSVGCTDIGTPMVVMTPPNGADCWSSNLDIITAEIAVIFDQTLYSSRRVYNMCPTTTVIGVFPTTGEIIPVGGDFPLVIINPNVHIKCQDPGNCIFSGGERQFMTLADNTLVQAFIALDPNIPPLPDGYAVETSNLLVEGMLFTGASDECDVCSYANVGMDSPGINMEFRNCVWREQDIVNPPMAALLLAYGGAPQSLKLTDCEIKDNTFQYATLWSTWSGSPPESGGAQVTVVGTTITNNAITGRNPLNNDSAWVRAAFIVMLFSDWVLVDTTITGNTLESGYAPINIINSNITVSGSSVDGNTINVQTGNRGCTEIQKVRRNEDGSYTLLGCQLFDPPPSPMCFSGASVVEVEGVGPVQLKDAKIGQKVLVAANTYEPIYSFGHSEESATVNLLKIITDSGSAVKLSADHMIFVESRGSIPAALVQVGDKVVVTTATTATRTAAVESIKTVTSDGIYAPFTPSGKIVVDGVLASSFVALNGVPAVSIGGINFSHQWLTHSFEFPHRVVCHYLGSCPLETYTTRTGISTWADKPKNLGLWFLGQNALVRGVLGALLVSVFVLFNIMEFIMLHPESIAVAAYLVYRLGRKTEDKQI